MDKIYIPVGGERLDNDGSRLLRCRAQKEEFSGTRSLNLPRPEPPARGLHRRFQ
jgi:hypothetical protein